MSVETDQRPNAPEPPRKLIDKRTLAEPNWKRMRKEDIRGYALSPRTSAENSRQRLTYYRSSN